MQNFLLAHISDLHYPVYGSFRFQDIFSKRITGRLNLMFSQNRTFKPRIFNSLLQHLQKIKVNHIAVTGDISNLAYPEEFISVRNTFEKYDFSSDRVTIIPGNHDAYLNSTYQDSTFFKYMGAYAVVDSFDEFPFLKQVGDINLIGLSSAIPTFWGMAYGKLGKLQLEKLDQLLTLHKNENNVVLIHHPPFKGPDTWHDMLLDGKDLMNLLSKHKINLVLFGHEHIDSNEIIEVNSHRIRFLGIGTAMLDTKNPNQRARAEILQFKDGILTEKWTIVHQKSTNHWKTITEEL